MDALMSKYDVIMLIAKRDSITFHEAQAAVKEFEDELARLLDEDASLLDLEDLIADYLGLEPDYLDIFLMDI